MTRAVPSGEGYIVELARAVRDVYRQAEDALVGVVADQVRRDIAHDTAPGNDPSTAGQDSTATRRARDEAAAVARVAAGAQRIVNRLDNALEDTVDATLESAQSEGIRQAGREIEALLHRSTRRNYRESANLAALNAFARGLVDTVRDAHRSVLRQTRDAYRQAIAETMAPKVAGASFRRRDHAQRALDRLADKGVAGFTDKAGRRWNLASYVEMATRAASARVMVDAHLDRLGTVGVDLVFVSNAPQECILCRPWEGKVLHRLGGAAGTIRVPSAVSDDLVEVKVAGTVAEAYAAGFGHPNCRHALSAFLPGATRIPTATEDPQGDADRQHLRYLERQVRRHRARAAAAVDDEARRDANRKAGAYQDRIAAHVAETGLIRQRNRERVNLGHKLEQIGRHPKLDQAAARRRDEWTISRNRLAEREQQRADAEARDADQRADALEATRLEGERAAAEAEQQRRDEAARLAEAQRQADEAAAAEQAERDAAERPALPDPDTDPVDPGGAPADLTDLELEDALGASLTAEDYDRFEALSAESDRRDAARAKREAKRERDRARRQRQREERDAAREEADRLAWERAERLIDRGMDPQAAEAEARGVDYYDIVKRDALLELEAQGYRGGWERATRAAFELELQLEVMRAEDATRGALLNRRARARGVDPKRLFYGSDAFARANAAEELLAYWDEHGGRLTLEHYRDRLLYGVHEANRRHGGREDYHQ